MCSDWMEENHRNGMCCKTSYPVDIRFDSVFDLNSEKIKENCRPLMHELLVANKMNATDMMENSLLEMVRNRSIEIATVCDFQTCRL